MDMTVVGLARPKGAANLHAHPPATPRSFFAARTSLLYGVVTLVFALAVAAKIDGGWLLRRWDEPVQRFVEAHRTDQLDTFFRLASRAGSTVVVLAAALLMGVFVYRRCRAVAVALVAAALARPLLEFGLKGLVGRARPDFDRMVAGDGFSFPSGHALAAMAVWGMVPLVVGLFTTRRGLWWASVFASGSVIVAIAASRVYLGVHWLSDVVAGVLIGAVFLLGVEWFLHRAHRVAGCGTPCSACRAP
jgi:undecaprenyl-diphosphatase